MANMVSLSQEEKLLLRVLLVKCRNKISEINEDSNMDLDFEVEFHLLDNFEIKLEGWTSHDYFTIKKLISKLSL